MQSVEISFLTGFSSIDIFLFFILVNVKMRLDPPAAGRKVSSFFLETWWRLVESAEELLRFLAVKATLRARRLCQDAVAGSFLRRWRAMLDGFPQRGVASALLSAKHGLLGKPHR